MKPLLFSLALCALGLPLYGTSFCVAPSATGNGSGSDWNNKAAWSSLTPSRGHIYFLADGAYGSKTLSTATSSTTLITIRKAIEADHGPSTGWSSDFGDGQAEITAPLKFTSSYWAITGQARTGIRAGYGIKITNAASPVNEAVFQCGISDTSNVSNITGSYLEIEGSGTNANDSMNDACITTFSTSGLSGCTDVKWDHCWIHDAGGVLVFWLQPKRATIEYSVVERNDSTPAQHSEGFVLRGKPTSSGATQGDCGDFLIRYNIIADIEGTAYIATPSGPTHHWTNVWVYGNVFLTPQTPTRGGCGDGVFAVWDCKVYGEARFTGNTIVNFRDALMGGFPNNTNHNPGFDIGIGYETTHMDELVVRNNLWVDCDSVDDPSDDSSSNIVSYTWTHNAYFATTNTNDGDGNKQVIGSDPLPAWQSGDFYLNAATTAGTTLASPYHLSLTTAAGDSASVTRGADGGWDRGALEYVSGGGGGDTTAPAVTITAPTSSSTYATSTTPLTTLAGTASDNVALASVTWSNDRGGSGTATGTTSWSVASVTLQSGANVLTVTATDTSSNTTTDTLTVTYTPPDVTAPSVTITSPTSAATYATAASTTSLSGTASDNVALTSVTWSNNRGGSGTATGTTTWNVASVTLQSGVNVLTVTATDTSSNTNTDTLTITYAPPGDPAGPTNLQLLRLNSFGRRAR